MRMSDTLNKKLPIERIRQCNAGCMDFTGCRGGSMESTVVNIIEFPRDPVKSMNAHHARAPLLNKKTRSRIQRHHNRLHGVHWISSEFNGNPLQ